MATKPRLVLTARDPAYLAQFSEYDVYIEDRKIGTLTGGAEHHFSRRLGRHAVKWMVWAAATVDGRTTEAVHTRREALADLLRLTEPEEG